MSKNAKMPYDITNCKETKLSYSSIHSQLNFLKGKVLTVIDASFVGEKQNKAIKDLIHNAFEEQRDWIYQLCGLPGDGEEVSEIIEQNVTTK